MTTDQLSLSTVVSSKVRDSYFASKAKFLFEKINTAAAHNMHHFRLPKYTDAHLTQYHASVWHEQAAAQLLRESLKSNNQCLREI